MCRRASGEKSCPCPVTGLMNSRICLIESPRRWPLLSAWGGPAGCCGFDHWMRPQTFRNLPYARGSLVFFLFFFGLAGESEIQTLHLHKFKLYTLIITHFGAWWCWWCGIATHSLTPKREARPRFVSPPLPQPNASSLFILVGHCFLPRWKNCANCI